MSTSFASRYTPRFDHERDEWVLKVPSMDVIRTSEDFYEVRLPIYAGTVLAPGGNILRPLRRKYRDWLLKQQGGLCAVCGQGSDPNSDWNLDHQPQLNAPGAKSIDYKMTTQNRVIHRKCDAAQKPRENYE